MYYASSDIVVLPYRRIYQSGVLMMSLCYKKPVIVSDLPSFKEIIVDQENGVFFSSDDSVSLAHAVSKLIAAACESTNHGRVFTSSGASSAIPSPFSTINRRFP